MKNINSYCQLKSVSLYWNLPYKKRFIHGTSRLTCLSHEPSSNVVFFHLFQL